MVYNFYSKKYKKPKDGSTSVLSKHVRVDHPGVIGATQNHGTLKTEDNEAFSIATLRNKIVEFIVVENQPFQLVEKPAFRNLLKLCNPAVELPCANTVKSDIGKKYEEEKAELKTTLQVK